MGKTRSRPISLSDEDRQQLNKNLSATDPTLAQRSQMVVLASLGVPEAEIARRVRRTPQYVNKVIEKFRTHGPLGISPGKPGRPPARIAIAKVAELREEVPNKVLPSIREVMRRTGIPRSSVQHYAARLHSSKPRLRLPKHSLALGTGTLRIGATIRLDASVIVTGLCIAVEGVTYRCKIVDVRATPGESDAFRASMMSFEGDAVGEPEVWWKATTVCLGEHPDWEQTLLLHLVGEVAGVEFAGMPRARRHRLLLH